MDASSLEALLFDPLKCSKMSIEQKRELVREVSKWSDCTTEMLHAWSRQEILQILCAELGKERKYTGLTKSKMIEQLMKIVREKSANDSGVQTSSEIGERTPKSQRKSDLNCPSSATTSVVDIGSGNSVFCKNSACKAKLSRDDVFCKRCSCCICRKYDDNKDPSLWLICNADPPFHSKPCGVSCHLECALQHDESGILKDQKDKGLDGSFCCISCGKVNNLLGSWRKQMVVARDTRRVDILGYRLSLAQKILAGTKHYQNLCNAVDESVEKLEVEVGPLTGLPVKKARGIVNRLSSGHEIQRLCTSAVESLDSLLSSRGTPLPPDCSLLASIVIRFEEVRSSSVTVVLNCEDSSEGNVVEYNLWHRKARDTDYPAEPTCRLFVPNAKFQFSGLNPSMEYFLKVVILNRDRNVGFCKYRFKTATEAGNLNFKNLEVESSQSPATNCSSLSNPSSVEDEAHNVVVPYGNKTSIQNSDKTKCFAPSRKDCNPDIASLLDEEHSLGKIISSKPSTDGGAFRHKKLLRGQMIEEMSMDNGSNMPCTALECVSFSEATLQITPYKTDGIKEGKTRHRNGKRTVIASGDVEPLAGSSSKKRAANDKDFEYYMKVIRWLECEGHIDAEFRQKFLTWYSLRATLQEVRIMRAFIDNFIDNPESLAAQLIDTFSDLVSNKRRSTVRSGFCLKLWH